MSGPQQTLRPLAITMGDAAGIGPEIVAKAFRDAAEMSRACFVAGDLAVMRRAAQAITTQHQTSLPVALIDSPAQIGSVPPRCIPLLQVTAAMEPPVWGRVSAAAGKAAADCVVWAARAALRGDIAGLVTAPLHKQALAAAGVPFPGHTELLQAEAAASTGLPVQQMPVRRMLANDELRTVRGSIHVAWP